MSKPICANPEDCCRELSRVWDALGITTYNGKSASENVAALRADCHTLKRAIAPASAGKEPWDGMPDLQFYVNVADRRRAAEQTIHAVASSQESKEPETARRAPK